MTEPREPEAVPEGEAAPEEQPTTPTSPSTGNWYPVNTQPAPEPETDTVPEEVGEERAGRLIVRTTAAPVDDAANQAVRKLVARHLGVPMRDIEIIRGHNRRDKTLAIDRRTQPRES